MKHKPLAEQVLVITGASSGIGLATAQAAAARGAKVVLAARSERTLAQLAAALASSGGEAFAVPCDVADREQVECAALRAVERYGRIDTWVNCAAIGMYGRLDEVSEVDSRRLFDVNFWGVVNGSLAALPHLKRAGGTLVNVGSQVAEGATPLLGTYVASKCAVKGFTETLRIELEEVDRAPISIALIEPQAVDTPFPQHARNYLTSEPVLPAPRIGPERVAEAILAAAVHPRRIRHVGPMAKLETLFARIAPGLGEKLAARQYKRQRSGRTPLHPEGALYRSSETTGIAGQSHGLGASA